MKLSAPLDQRSFEALAAELLARGAAEVSDASGAEALLAAFPPEVTTQEAIARAIEAAGIAGLPVVATERVGGPSVDWSGHWRRHFRPMRFGPLMVVPAWCAVPPGAELVLELDPGLSFGTGAHATSSMCLDWIVSRTSRQPPSRLLDLGVGSGLLALSALLLGVQSAVGVDVDSDALATASENARANGLAARLDLLGSDWFERNERFEVVIANLLTSPLVEEARQIARAVAPGGELILSGVLEEEVSEVREAYQSRGFMLENLTLRAGWARLDLRQAR